MRKVLYLVVCMAAARTASAQTPTLAGLAVDGADVTLTATPPPPVLTELFPASGVPGFSTTVTLSGAGFSPDLTVFAGIAIGVGDVTVFGPTSAAATFAIAPNAAVGPRGVWAGNAGGTSAPVTFTVLPPPPVLTVVTPASGLPGTSVTVALSGGSFVPGATFVNPMEGIAVSGIAGTAANAMKAVFTIAANATPGPRDVTLTTPSGTTNPRTFTVLQPPPILSSLAPASGARGQSVGVTLTGQHFIPGLTVIAGSGIGVSGVDRIDDTLVVATFAIDANAALGNRGIMVRTSGGTSASVPFAVLLPPPTLTGIEPPSGRVGNSLAVTVTGADFVAGLTLDLGGGVNATNVTVVNSTRAVAILDIAAGAALGVRDVTVRTPSGISGPIAFAVVPLPPALASIAPASGIAGRTAHVTLTGSNFVPGATAVDPIPGIAVGDPAVLSATAMTATFAIEAGAAPGPRNVRVSTAGGSSGSVAFTVDPALPDLAVTSTAGTFAVGFEESYAIAVRNVGSADSGAIALTDALPGGLTYVSGIGPGWSCSAAGQTLTCAHAGLAVDAAAPLILTVAVSPAAVPAVTHRVSVTTLGDPVAANDTAVNETAIAPTPSPRFVFASIGIEVGQQAWMGVMLEAPFPHDVTGSVLLSFHSTAAIPVDDPAIQFASGGRLAPFTIPANTIQARFGNAVTAGLIAFQTGTVAGTLLLDGIAIAGNVEIPFSPGVGLTSLTIPAQAPAIRVVQTTAGPTPDSVMVQVGLVSTLREVTAVALEFNTTPSIQLDCGLAAGCSVSGNTVTLDVKNVFDTWFISDVAFGGLSVLRLPLSIRGELRGSVRVTLRNSQGVSNAFAFTLP
jgi:uncharacterized repeat protein (TIGR01451 family)